MGKFKDKIATVNPAELLNYEGERDSPWLPQIQLHESWLACLVIAAYHHHKAYDFTELSAKFTDKGKAISSHQMIDVSAQLGLISRALHADVQQLVAQPCPSILKLQSEHYVVLTNIKYNRAYLNDPLRGTYSLSLDELEQVFSGVMIEITAANVFSEPVKKRTLKLSDFWSDISGLKRFLTQIVCLSLLIQVFVVAAPFFAQNVVDHVLPKGDTKLLLVLAIAFSALVIFEMLLTAVRNLSIMHLSTKLNIQMSANLFSHLIRLPMSFFQKAHMGDTLSRFDSLETVKQLLTTGLITVFVDSAMVITALIMMSLYSLKLTALILGIALVYLSVRLVIYIQIQRLTMKGLEAHGEVSTSFIESIRAIQSIKVFQKESTRQSVWINRYAKAINYDIGIARWNVAEEVLQGLLFGIENILVIYFISAQVMDNTLSMGMFFAFMGYKMIFVNNVNSLISKAMEFRLLSTHLERLSSIVFTPKEVTCNRYFPQRAYPMIEGRIRCEGVSFRYEGGQKNVLNDIYFNIHQGESVAIIGPSGVGKTTLMKIIMGLIIPTSGKVTVDEIDIMEHTQYRASVAAVLQEDELIYGTIAENISFFDEHVDIDWVEECTRNACIYDDVVKMSQGLHTLVGDVGAALSGGQAQRVLLARALYRKPRVLFLDEATSNLDSKTENFVNENIKNLAITRVIIAHRKDTIESVDRVIDLEALSGKARVRDKVMV